MKFKLLFLFLIICWFAQAETPVVQWARLITYTFYHSYPYAIAADDNGNVFVAGLFVDSINIGSIQLVAPPSKNGMYLAKYDRSGNVLWAKKDGTAPIETSYCTVDKDGNLILCGSFVGQQATFGSITLTNIYNTDSKKYFVVKYSPAGDVIWARTTPNTNNYCEVTAVAADKSGNIYAAGFFRDPTITLGSYTITKSSVYNMDLFLLKYDSFGNVLWAKGIDGNGSELIKGLSTDPTGNVYITGYFNGTSISFDSQILNNASKDQTDVFIAKYSPNGNVLWAQRAGGIGSDSGNSISVDKDGNAYVGGDFTSATFQIGTKVISNPYKMDKCFLAKYDASGNVIWARSSTNTNTGGDKICSVVADGFGNVYGIGKFTSQTQSFGGNTLWNSSYNVYNQPSYNPFDYPFDPPTDGFMSKYDSNGNVIWLHNTAEYVVDAGHVNCVDKDGNMFFTGDFSTNYPDPIEAESAAKFFKVKGSGNIVAKVFSDSTFLPYDVYFCDASPVKLTCPPNTYYPTWLDKNNNLLGNAPTLDVAIPIDSAIYFCKFKDIRDSSFVVPYRLIRTGPVADFSIGVTDCKSSNIQFTNLSTAKQGILSFLWDFGDGTTSTITSPQHKYTTNGIHQVSLTASTGSLGCSVTVNMATPDIGKPIIKITGDSILCHGVPVLLKATGAATYQWSNKSTADSIHIAIPQKVWVLGYSASGCVSDTAYLKVTDRTPLVTITGNTTYCPGLSTTLKVRGASSYKWSTGSTSDSINVSSQGSVWVVGYTATCVSDTVRYSIAEEPDFSVSLEGNLYICSGESTTLTVSGADSNRWSTGEKTSTVTINKAGSYSVTGVNKRGCEKTISFQVNEIALPNADFNVSPTLVDSRHNTISCSAVTQPNIDYKWDMGDGTTEIGSDIQHSYTVSNSRTDYKITLAVTNKWGCSNSQSKEIVVTLFIPNIFSPNGDGQNDIFMPDVALEILDRNGMSLYKGTTGWDGNYNGKKMPDDTYFYVVSYKDKNGQTQIQKGYVMLKR
jgi:gliding motility-associated-like protein